MEFDGVVSKEGDGVGIWIISPKNGSKLYSFKLTFNCTNNVAKYGALILGLNILNDLKAKRIIVNVDSKLVINQTMELFRLSTLWWEHT